MRLERHAWTISRHIADPSSRPTPIGIGTSIAHKFFRVFGLTKMRILVAATIVATTSGASAPSS
jgi:hypothetical protein